jgi:hypothetical protein
VAERQERREKEKGVVRWRHKVQDLEKMMEVFIREICGRTESCQPI